MAWCTRRVVLPLIAFGGALNICFLCSTMLVYVNARKDAESEWEGGGHDVIPTTTAFIVTYCLISLTASLIGGLGVFKRTPSYIHLFLQYTLGDLVLSAVTLISLAFTSSRSSRWHESTCNELFTQPDLLRLLVRFGVNIQECEIWLEKFITTAITVLCIVLILKVQFIILVSTFYATLSRRSGHPASVVSSARTMPIRKTYVSRRRADKRQAELPPYTDSTTNAYPLVSIHKTDCNVVFTRDSRVKE